ncbi:MAG TPA: DUF6788 family protein [Streptosporangiaceae bacterium]|nr:DUF6788 family protein [Streptosporangiaceae bacterium]
MAPIAPLDWRAQSEGQPLRFALALGGALTVGAYRCGKTTCRCHADPPILHGPYAQWTRKVDGKTVTRRLTDAELADYQPLFDNARKLRALLAELQALTLAIVEAAPGDPPGPSQARTRTRSRSRPTARAAALVPPPIRGLSDNGTVIGVKEPRGVALTPMAVPMSLGAGMLVTV